MKIASRYTLAAGALAGCFGCADMGVSPIFHPGPAWYQQAQAQRFDPYPTTDIGPEVEGGRPLDYIRPAPLTERVQDPVSFQERYGQPPPPGIYKPPRGMVPAQQQIQYTPGGVLPLPPPPLQGQPTLAPAYQPQTAPAPLFQPTPAPAPPYQPPPGQPQAP